MFKTKGGNRGGEPRKLKQPLGQDQQTLSPAMCYVTVLGPNADAEMQFFLGPNADTEMQFALGPSADTEILH